MADWTRSLSRGQASSASSSAISSPRAAASAVLVAPQAPALAWRMSSIRPGCRAAIA
jgi:hypothetical protein